MPRLSPDIDNLCYSGASNVGSEVIEIYTALLTITEGRLLEHHHGDGNNDGAEIPSALRTMADGILD